MIQLTLPTGALSLSQLVVVKVFSAANRISLRWGYCHHSAAKCGDQ